jgi:hypothetical protein
MTETSIFEDLAKAIDRSTDEYENLELMVPRALGQTYRQGFKYATVPSVLWSSFCQRAGTPGWDVSGVPWGNLCMITPGSNMEFGPVTICLLDRGHKGECGWLSRTGAGVTET